MDLPPLHRWGLVLVLTLLVAPSGAVGVTGDVLEPGEDGRVVEVVDGDTLTLEDGRPVRLVGLQAPKLPLDREGFKTWPLAETARETLSRLVLGRTVSLRYGGRRIDRHGRTLAHLFLDDGTWIQGEMLRLGLARVYTFADNRALIDEMYARERQARRDRRGIWRDAFYAIRTPQDVRYHVGEFQIVDGTVIEASRVKKWVFLNFGPDWRTDFTVVIPVRVLSLFKETGIDPLGLANSRIRVRGWVERWNGPMIEVTHPEQMEYR
jgi:endonuclease YncB( thermonuclease family)